MELLKVEGDAVDATFHSTRYPCRLEVNPEQNTPTIDQREESYSKQKNNVSINGPRSLLPNRRL
jgi:hypothetical protein